jgi:hypothetical protein
MELQLAERKLQRGEKRSNANSCIYIPPRGRTSTSNECAAYRPALQKRKSLGGINQCQSDRDLVCTALNGLPEQYIGF